MNGWQPIETAPKDGTRILGLNAHHYQIRVTSYSKLNNQYNWHNPCAYGWHGFDGDWGNTPTHWQPLPDSTE